ncbi:MAG: hypothetical protein M3436_01485 [Pseudomonadota bacterium]|nr:hypothetical protein [Pseudomonadota bacterium]
MLDQHLVGQLEPHPDLADLWLGMQMDYDLAQAEKHASRLKVMKVWPQAARP